MSSAGASEEGLSHTGPGGSRVGRSTLLRLPSWFRSCRCPGPDNPNPQGRAWQASWAGQGGGGRQGPPRQGADTPNTWSAAGGVRAGARASSQPEPFPGAVGTGSGNLLVASAHVISRSRAPTRSNPGPSWELLACEHHLPFRSTVCEAGPGASALLALGSWQLLSKCGTSGPVVQLLGSQLREFGSHRGSPSLLCSRTPPPVVRARESLPESPAVGRRQDEGSRARSSAPETPSPPGQQGQASTELLRARP